MDVTDFGAGAQYIAGRQSRGSGEPFQVVNPADGSVVEQVALATTAEVDAAVAAALSSPPAASPRASRGAET